MSDKTCSNIHEGHRKRLRESYIKSNGSDALRDHQLLELLLFYAIPRRDVNPLAHRLVNRFGSLRGVLEASFSELAEEGVSQSTAILNEASYCDAYGTEHVKTYTCYNKDYVMPAQEVVAAVEDGTQKVVAFSVRFSAEISIADSESERLKFMEKYLEYSTLDVLPDWKYNGSRYYSETVGLFLNVVLDDENKIIYIGLER